MLPLPVQNQFKPLLEMYARVLMSSKNSKGLKHKTVRVVLEKKNIKLPVLLMLILVCKTVSGGNERTYHPVLIPLLSPSDRESNSSSVSAGFVTVYLPC